MENTNLFDTLRNYFTELDDCKIVAVWNEYVRETSCFDDEIFDFDDMEEMIANSNEGGLFWVNCFFYGSDDYNKETGANPNRNYFTFNGYGNIESFDYIYNQYSDTFNHIEIDDLINYIIENNDSLYDDGIEEILDNASDEETDEE